MVLGKRLSDKESQGRGGAATGNSASDPQGLLSKTFITTCPHDCKSFLTYHLYAPSSHQQGYQTLFGWPIPAHPV